MLTKKIEFNNLTMEVVISGLFIKKYTVLFNEKNITNECIKMKEPIFTTLLYKQNKNGITDIIKINITNTYQRNIIVILNDKIVFGKDAYLKYKKDMEEHNTHIERHFKQPVYKRILIRLIIPGFCILLIPMNIFYKAIYMCVVFFISYFFTKKETKKIAKDMI